MDFVKYRVFPKGYMIRTSSESSREQVRISREALQKGVSFRRIGCDFIRQYKKNPSILAVKMLFITAPDADYAALTKDAKTVRDITMSLTKILEGMPTDCGSCNLKAICDEVEGMRELHFGKEPPHHRVTPSPIPQKKIPAGRRVSFFAINQMRRSRFWLL